MEAKFSPRVKDFIRISREEALNLNNDFVSPEHLLLGLIKLNEGKGFQLLQEFNLDFSVLKKELEKVLVKSAHPNAVQLTSLPLLKQTENIIKQSYLESKQFKSAVIGTEHLLLTILRHEDSAACKVLNKYGVIYDNAKDEYEAMIEEQRTPKAEFPGGNDEEEKKENSKN